MQADEQAEIDDTKTPNSNSNSDYTLLMQAAERGNLLKVKTLIQAGDDLNIQADRGVDSENEHKKYSVT